MNDIMPESNTASTDINKQLVHKLPKHIAIIMDGNGRWAASRSLPRIAGHRAGTQAVRSTVEYCVELKIEVLTLFAFSSENWHRPAHEVESLMDLFCAMLEKEAPSLKRQNIQLQIVGDRESLDKTLVARIEDVERLTADNTGLKLVLLTNYGGRWDIIQAAKKIAQRVQQGELCVDEITEKVFSQSLSLCKLPEPDLFIRTSGEVRISNFLIWQLAYTEMHFTPTLWPDFNRSSLDQALLVYAKRQRRYGCTTEQPHYA